MARLLLKIILLAVLGAVCFVRANGLSTKYSKLEIDTDLSNYQVTLKNLDTGAKQISSNHDDSWPQFISTMLNIDNNQQFQVSVNSNLCPGTYTYSSSSGNVLKFQASRTKCAIFD